MSDSDYFQSLCDALSEAGVGYPVLLVDHQRLVDNIRRLREAIGKDFQYRIVAKSLPSLPLLDLIMKEAGTRRLMCFHLPFLMDLVSHYEDADILIGKPLPGAALKHFYTWLIEQPTRFSAETQLQWLVDSRERLLEYENIAKDLQVKLKINLEIDIGLHRGGFDDLEDFSSCLELIEHSEHLSFSGIMGYEAHITKIPGLMGGPSYALHKAKSRYAEFVSCIEKNVSADLCDLCLNTGGSTTFPMYGSDKNNAASYSANELSAASALVKPSDFDVETLVDYEPAAFIASPVLKQVDCPVLPGPELVSKTLRQLGILPSKAVFIYGGNWLADPVFPFGSEPIKVFGHSSNQEMYSWDGSPVNKNSYMLFRPKQSEAVLLQFGKIAVFKEGKIVDWWQTLSYPDGLYTAIP